MTTMIHQHHDHDDIQKLFIDTDIHLWKEETEIIANEVNLFVNLLSVRLFELSKTRNISFNALFDEIDYFTNANPEFQEKLTGYLVKLEGLKECEDLQCETHFLNGHSTFKKEMQEYLTRYRQLKRNIFEGLAIGTNKI